MDRRNFNKTIVTSMVGLSLPLSLRGKDSLEIPDNVISIDEVRILLEFNMDHIFNTDYTLKIYNPAVEIPKTSLVIEYRLNKEPYTVYLEGFNKTWSVPTNTKQNCDISITIRDMNNNVVKINELKPKTYYNIDYLSKDYKILMKKFKLEE